MTTPTFAYAEVNGRRKESFVLCDCSEQDKGLKCSKDDSDWKLGLIF